MPPASFGFKDSAELSAHLSELSDVITEQCEQTLPKGDANVHLRRIPLINVEYDDLSMRVSDALDSPVDACDIELFHSGLESGTDLQLLRMHGQDNERAVVFKKIAGTHHYATQIESYSSENIVPVPANAHDVQINQLLQSLEHGSLPLRRMGELKSRRDELRKEFGTSQSEAEILYLGLNSLLGACAVSTTIELVYQTVDGHMNGITLGEELIVDSEEQHLTRYAKIGTTKDQRYVIKVPDDGLRLPVEVYPERITAFPVLRTVRPEVREGRNVFPNRTTVNQLVTTLRSIE